MANKMYKKMKRNQKKGWAVIMSATISLALICFAVYASNKNTHFVEWRKVEPGKPDSIMGSIINGDTSLVLDTMKLVRSEQGNVIVSIDDTAKSEIILVKR
jgi:hypothetical protein